MLVSLSLVVRGLKTTTGVKRKPREKVLDLSRSRRGMVKASPAALGTAAARGDSVGTKAVSR